MVFSSLGYPSGFGRAVIFCFWEKGNAGMYRWFLQLAGREEGFHDLSYLLGWLSVPLEGSAKYIALNILII
jgi:hypothetical protein